MTDHFDLHPTDARNASYIHHKPKHISQKDHVLRMMRDYCAFDASICIHRVKVWTDWEKSTISRVLNELHGGKNGTEFPKLIEVAPKQRRCWCCKNGKIVPTHYVLTELGRAK